jgi:hypothetical protein
MKTAWILAPVLALVAVTGSPAYAQGPATPAAAARPGASAPAQASVAAARNWAAQHGVPTRDIEVGPADRRVVRTFVPVQAGHWGDFIQTFGNQKNSLMLKLDSGNHLMAVMDGKTYLWARETPYAQYQAQNVHIGTPEAKAVVVHLTDEEYGHVQKWFQHRADPNDAYFASCSGSACMDFVGNIEVAPGANGQHTLRTIPQQEIGQQQQATVVVNGNQKYLAGSMAMPAGKRLFDLLGIARSKDGRNMTYNIVHAANDRVSVIGIPVADQAQTQQQRTVVNGRVVVQNVAVNGGAAGVERFKQMTDEQILGPQPPQGLANVVRQEKK